MKLGRPKGVPNKLSGQVKENIVHVFDQMGGVKKMTAWALENLTEFYRLYSRLAPTDIQLNVTREVKEIPDDELQDIAARGSDGASEETGGEEKPSQLH